MAKKCSDDDDCVGASGGLESPLDNSSSDDSCEGSADEARTKT